MADKTVDQQRYFTGATLVDQFGRTWGTSLDKETGWDHSPITPAGWSDDIRIPAKYVNMIKSVGGDGHPVSGKVKIDVERFIRDQTEATKEWEKDLALDALHIYKHLEQGTTVEDLEKDRNVIALAGLRPSPTPEEIEKYFEALEVPEISDELDYKTFVKTVIGRGGNLEAAGKAWRLHKENLEKEETANA